AGRRRVPAVPGNAGHQALEQIEGPVVAAEVLSHGRQGRAIRPPCQAESGKRYHGRPRARGPARHATFPHRARPSRRRRGPLPEHGVHPLGLRPSAVRPRPAEAGARSVGVRGYCRRVTSRTEWGEPEGLFDAPAEAGAAAGAASRAPDSADPALPPQAVPSAGQPLAVRMRPRALDEVVGQAHLLGPGTPIRQLVDRDAPMSLVLWGPPGTGKTTLATVVSHVTARRFVEISAVSDGVKRVRAEIDLAKRELGMTGRQTVLFVDEVHRFNKAQQDALLPAVENRWVSFIGATTENPFFSVISPLLSRSLLLTLEPLGDDDLREVIHRALTEERGLGGAVSL